MKRYRIRNWERFQHYKDRAPPWIKLHFELLASEDWVMLDDASKLLAVVCMLVASRNDGCIPDNPGYLRRIAYLDQTPDLTPLISCGFLKEVQADASVSLAPASAAQADARPEERRDREETEAEKNSEPIGSDAPSAPAVVPIDIRAALFREGLEIVRAMTGKPEAACRSLLGQWLKLASDDASAVLTRLRRARDDNRAELVSWMEASLRAPARDDERIYRGVL